MGASSSGKVVISLGTSDTFFAAMKDIHTDPNGSGHVFGNPSKFCSLENAGNNNNVGSQTKYMTLQCFLNGS